MAPRPSADRTADPSMLATLAGALERHSTEDLSAWVLVAGSVDPEVRSLFSRARVVMWDGASHLRLPRDSFALGIWFPDGEQLGRREGRRDLEERALDTMVKIRNALARDAVLLVVADRERLASLRELAETAGLSRFDVCGSTSSIGVVELRR